MKKEYEKPCVVKIECDMVLPISSSVSTETEEKDDVAAHNVVSVKGIEMG